MRAAESRAAAAEAEAHAARDRLARAEERRGGAPAGPGRFVSQASTSAEARLSARVTELLGELAAANARVAQLANARNASK